MFKGVPLARVIATLLIIVALLIVVLIGFTIQEGALDNGEAQAQATPNAPVVNDGGVPATANGKTRNFTLYVRSTWIKTPDGQKIWAFGYTDDPKGPAKIPGPTIVVDQGDTVNITLVNDQDPTKTTTNPDGDGHTIHLHGLDLPSAMDGDPMTAPGGHAVLPGTKYTYRFVAQYAGTYWYHCHESAAEHIQMGMYGALIIRPKGQPNVAYAGTPKFDKEYTFVLSDMDSAMHTADYNALHTDGGTDPNWTQYKPNFFFINGKYWPDTMSDPNDNINATVGQTVLVRLINTGYVVHSMHAHGFHFLVVGSDGRKLDAPYYKDTISVGPAERYDVLLKLDQPGRFMFHDHAEQMNTNDGEYPGGMLTMISVNNPDGSNPVPMKQMMQSGG